MEADQDKAMEVTPTPDSWQRTHCTNRNFKKDNFNYSIFETPTDGGLSSDSGFHSITPDSAESLQSLSILKQCDARNFISQVKHPVNSTPVNADLDTSLYPEDELMKDLFEHKSEQFNLNDDENMISSTENSTNISIFLNEYHVEESKCMSDPSDNRCLIDSTSYTHDCSITSLASVSECTSMSTDELSPTQKNLNPNKTNLEFMLHQVNLLPKILSPSNSYSSPVNDRPNKKRIFLNGIERIDILYFLGVKENFLNIVTNIFSYLDPYDLINVKKVSRTWSQILMNIKPAQNRLRKWRKQFSEQKENLSESKKPLLSVKMSSRPIRRRLSTIENISLLQPIATPHYPTSPAVSPSKRRFHQFQKEGQKLKEGERLQRCPKCTYPSRDPGTTYATCTRLSCKFKFCIFCFGEYMENHICPPLYTPRPCKRSLTIGSKGSKRNLRRL